MRIRSLRAVGWRNLAPLRLVLDPGARLHVLHGDNGQGKTNVLEALYYLARFRSFRTGRAADLVQRGAARAAIGVDAETRDLVRTVEIELTPAVAASDPAPAESTLAGGTRSRTVTRTITLDGKPTRTLAVAFGALSVVLFVPEDLLLIRAAPAARRHFLDMAISGVEPGYFGEAAVFQRVLRSRNALLRSGRTTAFPELLETYDQQLAASGARVVMRRRQLVTELAPGVQRIFRTLHADLSATLHYQSDSSVMAAATEAEVAAALATGFTQKRAVDERRGHTTFGPQTDDLEIQLDDRPAREHASQGQLRSLVLAMKLAELANVEARRGEVPVLLLDDVPSELDPTRRRYLFETLESLSCQTLVSVADQTVVPALGGRVDFRVEKGRVTTGPVFPLQTED